MKKAILISIQPQWVEKILNGEKTIEIRKSMPKCELPIDVYIYCTKSKINLYSEYIEDWQYFDGAVAEPFMDYKQLRLTKEKYKEGIEKYPLQKVQRNKLNGKVLAKFTLNKIDKLKYEITDSDDFLGYDIIASFNYGEIEDKCCLKDYEIDKYLEFCTGYAWHINNLEIFDKPMELNQFEKYYDDSDDKKPCCCGKECQYESYDWCEHQNICSIDYDGANCPFLKVSRPPQSWQYVYVEVE